MPPPSNRMTKNQERNFRYRPGKAEAEESESEEESGSEEEAPRKPSAPAPKASTFPKKLTVDVSKVNRQASTAPPPKQAQPDEDLEGFVTASESSEEEEQGGSEEDEDEESEDEESSSDDEPKRPMIAPKFISKAQRNKQTAQPSKSAEEIAAEEEQRRKEKADEMLQAQLDRDAAARAVGKKAWDDDDAIMDEVDDTDGLDQEAEHAAWKLRELKRVRRDRLAIEEKEKEREEIERRRNMTAEEREAEDKVYIDAQNEEHEGRGKMGFMQKYFHKGAFFQGGEEGEDEEVKAAMSRDLAGARYADETSSKEVLPEYMRIRDMSKLGKKGRTKYKDLKNEDTGRWGSFEGRKRRDEDGLDERFRSDDHRRDGGTDRTGANAAPVGERRRREDDGYRDRDEKRARYEWT